MKAKNKKYLIIGAILAVLIIIVVSVVTYVVLTREPEPLTLSIAHYYDKDGNEIKVGKQQAVIGGVEGVRYVDFLVESYNADTVDLDFEITSATPVELIFVYDVAQPQVITLIPDDTGGWTSELVDMLPYVGTTVDFSVSVTGSAVAMRQSFTVTSIKSVTVDPDPFASFSVSIYTTAAGPPASSYCSSGDGGDPDDWIERVQFVSIDVTSGGDFIDGYEDLTSNVATVDAGQSYAITLTMGINGAWTQYGKVWIDFNQDNVFDESEATELGSCNSNGCTLTSTITIPLSALSGNTRMRVSEKYNAYPTACETMSYGEVEDYTIDIQ